MGEEEAMNRETKWWLLGQQEKGTRDDAETETTATKMETK